MKNDKINSAYNEMIINEDKEFGLSQAENIDLLKKNFKDLTIFLSWVKEDIDNDVTVQLNKLIDAVKSCIDRL